jgi:two-component system, NarL family, sensor kinase
MIFLQALAGAAPNVNSIMILGTLGMMTLSVGMVLLIMHHQKRVMRFNQKLKQIEADRQREMLNASIRFQEEERNRIAADLHDDVGPLLATARLYLNENVIHMEPAAQLQAIFAAKQIIDDAIQQIRNISHSMMPPTLKNFGLESAVNDLFQKINGSGRINVSARFHDYRTRLVEDTELLLFRIIQELINNLIKHSGAAFIHLTQNNNGNFCYIRLHHDGNGLRQEDFETFAHNSNGLGLKNIANRIKILNARIYFEQDPSHTYFKITIELGKAYSK